MQVVGHIATIDDKGKGVDEGQDKHGPAHPAMPDVELLGRDARDGGDDVRFGAQQEDKGHAGERHPARTGGQRRGAAVLCVGRPVVGPGSQGHGRKEDDAGAEKKVGAEGLGDAAAVGPADAPRLVGAEPEAGDGAAPRGRLAGEACGRVGAEKVTEGEDGNDGEEKVYGGKGKDMISLVPGRCKSGCTLANLGARVTRLRLQTYQNTQYLDL